MTLDQVRPGSGGTILSIGGQGALRRRLLDMGLTPKTHVTVRKKAPMGDPIELFLRGYALTIRKEEAAKIEVTEEDDNGRGATSPSRQTAAKRPYSTASPAAINT